MILFSQYLEKAWIPIPNMKKGFNKFKIFNLFPVLLTILIMWAICGICTLAGVEDQAIRTDGPKMTMFNKAKWVRFPTPCKEILNHYAYLKLYFLSSMGHAHCLS